MILAAVPPERVEDFWHLAERYVRAAMETVGLQSAESVAADVFNGDSLLWLVCTDDDVRGAVVTQLVDDDVCEIVACGLDDVSESIHLLVDIEEYAKGEGRKMLRLIGRKGWIRKLKRYRQRAVILEKELS